MSSLPKFRKGEMAEPKVAYVFPGQGSQRVGMGRDLYESFDSARAIFNEADKILGFPLSRLCFEGPEEELRQIVRELTNSVKEHSDPGGSIPSWIVNLVQKKEVPRFLRLMLDRAAQQAASHPVPAPR